MIFRINGLQFGGNSKYQVLAPVTGLDTAAIRTAGGNFSGRDGGYVSSQLYSTRTIVLNGFYRGTSCQDAETLRSDLSEKLKIRTKLPIFIETFARNQYLAEGFVTDIKFDITAPTSGEFQVTFLCPDPFLYDAGDGTDPYTGYLQQLFFKVAPGGYTEPYTLPTDWVAGNPETPILNAGNVAISPEFILENEYHDPTIRNLTTGKFITLNVTTTNGDRIFIDMKNREITLNDVSIASYRTIDSNWWTLEPGNNQVILETTDSGDKNWGLIRWRQGYEAI